MIEPMVVVLMSQCSKFAYGKSCVFYMKLKASNIISSVPSIIDRAFIAKELLDALNSTKEEMLILIKSIKHKLLS